MKVHPLLALVIVIALLFVGAACKKGNDATAPAATEKLTRIHTGAVVTHFLYSHDKLIEIRDSITGQTTTTSRRFEYQNRRLVKGTYGSMTYTYSYPADDSVVVHTASNSAPFINLETFKYNRNKLLRYIRFGGNTSNPEPEIMFVYSYDGAGNISRRDGYSFDNVVTEQWHNTGHVLTTYDTKTNDRFVLENRDLPYIERNNKVIINNPVQNEYFDETGTYLKKDIFTYEYDDKGRVTKMIRKVLVGQTIVLSDTSTYSYR
jgi:hypothetical protein